MKNTILAIRTCRADMTSKDGFRWPESGPVEAPDWRDDYNCGGGLHVLLPGHNDPGVWYGGESGAKWLAVEVDPADLRTGQGELVDKAKCRRCVVVHCGTRESLFAYLVSRGVPGPWYMALLVGGYGSTLTGGDGSTLTGGDGSTLSIKWYDGIHYRITIGYVGEDGIKPNTPYCCESGKFVEVAKR